MNRTADVVVIGGGVIGTSVAYFLSSAGAEVLVLEKEEIAAGASGHGPGFFNAFGGDFSPGDHLALGLESIRLIREHRAHLEEFQEEPNWFNDRPGIAPAFTEDALRHHREMYEASGSQLEAAGAGAEWLDAAQVQLARQLASPDTAERLRLLVDLQWAGDAVRDPGPWLERLSRDPNPAVRLGAARVAYERRLTFAGWLDHMADTDPDPTVRHWAGYYRERSAAVRQAGFGDSR